MQRKQITRSPIDNSVYVERQLAIREDVKQTIALAKTTQGAWRNQTVTARADICRKMVDAFVENEDEIAEQLCWMMGRPIRYAKGEVAGMAERARYMIDVAFEALKPEMLPEKVGFTRYIKREALGTVFVVAPWNYPYLTAINSIIPAIMAGNSVILKASAQTPLCAEQLASAFDAAGLPKGIFQFLHLSHEDTQWMLSEGDLDFVAFTGSVAGGAMVEEAIAGKFIGSGLELGGKDPAYIRHDADIDYAVETAIDGAFFNSGQSCCGIERIYVHSAVYDEFVEKTVALVKQYKLGRSDDPDTTLGPLVRAQSADFVRKQIADALKAGAQAHIDASLFEYDKPGSAYLAPQVLTNVDHSMLLMTEESFGPVVGIMRVESDEEAISLMNDSEFGLTASVFSRDIEAAVDIGERLNTGTFFVNRCDYLDPGLAWTGVKNSGRGCTLSKLGYESLTRPKSFHLKTDIGA